MSVSKSPARAVADLSDGVVLATVEIEAPPERVFRALTDPNEVVAWWGSAETYRTEEWSADVRVGGRWQGRGRSADGKPYSVGGEFVEVDPPRRLVQTWNYDWEGGQSTVLAYKLEPIDGGTRLTVRHTGFGDRRESCRSHGDGWEMVLGWLKAYVTAPLHFLCRLLPPRGDFARTMSLAERRIMHEHAAYWRQQCLAGTVVAYGPVADPQGVWGVVILRVRTPAEAAELQANDPAMRAGIGFRYESLPMARAIVAAEVVAEARRQEPVR